MNYGGTVVLNGGLERWPGTVSSMAAEDPGLA